MSPIRYARGMYLLIAVFLLLAWGGDPAIGGEGPASGVLDGKTFVVEQGEKGQGAKGTDTLIFKNGRFRSAGCDQYGFGEGAYTATAQGDIVRFIAETTSETNWYKPNPKPLEKWAKGELKKSE